MGVIYRSDRVVSGFLLRVVLLLLVVSVIFLLLPLVAGASAYATTYYVAGDTGSDSNPGTAEAPWATIQKAADTMVAGDTVNVKGGVTYTGIGSSDCGDFGVVSVVCPGHSGTVGNNIVYRAWPGTGTPVVDASGIAAGFCLTNNINYLVIEGFIVKNTTGGFFSGGIFLLMNAGYQIIRNNIFMGNRSGVFMGTNDHNVKVYNNVFFDNGGGYVNGGCSGTDVFYNNIFVGNTTAVGPNPGPIGDYNVFYDNETDYKGILPGSHDLLADPLFVDPDNGDFRLQAQSPAINAGATLAEVTADILGVSRPQLGSYDIGAYEYLDETAPGLALDIFATPTSDTTPAFLGTAVDMFGTVTAVQYQMDGVSGSWIDCAAVDGAFDEVSEAYTCAVGSALADGEHTIYMRVSDSNGNTTATGSYASVPFAVDTTPPGFPVESNGEVVNITPGSVVMVDTPRPGFVGVTEPYAHLEIRIYSDVIVGEMDADENGNWSWMPGENIPEGSHRVEIRVTDLAGNEAEYEYTLEVGLADTGEGVVRYMVAGMVGMAVALPSSCSRFRKTHSLWLGSLMGLEKTA